MTLHLSPSRLLVVAIAASLPCVPCAGQTFVVPAEATVGPGEPIGQPLFFGNASFGWPGLRVQALYDTAQIAPSVATIDSLSIRKALGPLSNAAVTVQATIRMSTSAAPPSSVGADFEENHGPDVTTVFQGTITLPANGPTSQWPAPWQAPIVLQTPFSFVKAPGSLIVDIATTGTGSAGSWSVERYELDEGDASTDLVQTGCASSTGVTVSGRTFQSLLIPGGHFRVGYNFYPSNQPLLHASLIGIGFAGTNAPGLPFSLSTLGLPSASGCRWGVDVAFTLDATYYPGPATHATFGMVGMGESMPIPNDPALVDGEFFSQALSFDAGPGGAPQLLASGSERLRIGSGLAPAAATVSVVDHLAATGTVRLGHGIAMRFN